MNPLKILPVILVLSAQSFLAQSKDNTLSPPSANYLDFPDSLSAYETDEYLIAIRNNPINLNTASENDLLRIPFITPVEVRKIIFYRDSVSHIFSFRELYFIPGIDTEKIKLIEPFVNTGGKQKDKPAAGKERKFFLDRAAYDAAVRLINNIEASEPTRNKQFYALKFHAEMPEGATFAFSSNRFSQKQINDFYSFYLTLNHVPGVEKLIIGDYHIAFGSGLVFGKYFSVNKSFNTETALISSEGFAEENLSLSAHQLMRGITAVVPLTTRITVLPFIAFRTLAGTPDSTGILSLSANQLKSIYNDLTVSGDNTVDEFSTGLVVNSRISRSLSINGLYSYAHYNREISSSTGKTNAIERLALSFLLQQEHYTCTGEFANVSKSMPYRFTISMKPAEYLSVVYSLRNFPTNSCTPYSQRSSIENTSSFEAGNLFALRYKLHSLSLTSYFDQYTTSDEKPGAEELHGNEYYIRLENEFNDELATKIFCHLNRQEVGAKDGNVYRIMDTRNDNIGITLIDQPSERIQLRFSTLYHSIDQPSSHSDGLGQLIELLLRPTESFQIQTAFCAFRTGSAASSLSFFEPGVPGIPSTGSLSGDGSKIAIAFQYKPGYKIQIYGKYSIQEADGKVAEESNHAELKVVYVF
jgi:hypothetical protein